MDKTFEEVLISTGTTTAKIAPERGGLVTSFSVDDSEILFMDRDAFNDATKNVRGGIPVLFPNAGPLKSELYNLPQHGFARRMPWSVIELNRDSVILRLLPDRDTKTIYHFDFELNLRIGVSEDRLNHVMTVKNTDDKPMPIAYGTHPYLALTQEEKHKLATNIRGFAPGKVDWQQNFDEPFGNPGLVEVSMPGKNLIIESDPNIFTFMRIWHLPGKDFICIEPWMRDNFALDNPGQSAWIDPKEKIDLAMSIEMQS